MQSKSLFSFDDRYSRYYAGCGRCAAFIARGARAKEQRWKRLIICVYRCAHMVSLENTSILAGALCFSKVLSDPCLNWPHVSHRWYHGQVTTPATPASGRLGIGTHRRSPTSYARSDPHRWPRTPAPSAAVATASPGGVGLIRTPSGHSWSRFASDVVCQQDIFQPTL